ncbi:myotubularin-related protein 3 isoform X3 [Pleurodeles waltl]|uniref:myotubularin-related protein 3 isoform X3 n=1 Tax=Pleurodeles waltl TaxID=8319 RepID=UPI00370991A1
MEEEGQQSLECIQANQIFPRKQLIRDEEDLQVPFLELHGESTEYVGRAEDAIIALSNYRLHIKFKESSVSVPLQLIESVECRDIFQLHLTCKDCKVIRCQCFTFEQCQEWLKRLNNTIRPPSKIEDLFSFAYHAWCMEVYASEKEQHGDLCRPDEQDTVPTPGTLPVQSYQSIFYADGSDQPVIGAKCEHVSSRFKNEVERMGFDMNNAWRISNINEKYRLCASYPQELIVPAWITDKELENVASFRSWKRIPAVVYRHQSNGTVIARCGQPEVSWWGWRNADDEHLVQSLAKACATDSKAINNSKLSNGNCSRNFSNGGNLSDVEFDSSLSNAGGENIAIQPQKLLILDARSYAAAVANRAKGGGCECPEYYPNCEVVFMGMANIHSIRKSFQSLRLLCSQVPDPSNWLSALESTKWLQHLSVLLKSSLLVVHALDRDLRPVLVHCSDGWDRTPQITALSKLLLDPYYRTIEGFQVLVEMEWLDFGHKFADRCGHGETSDDLNERCPVFLQWLDCVHQLQRQFPCSFEFNEAFLVKLVQHTYSCLFGTFLCNNAKERGEKHTQERTCSVWSLLRAANKSFKNLLYSSQSEIVLYPVCHVRNLMLWSSVYLPGSTPCTPADDSGAPYPIPGSSPEEQSLGRIPKTRSFDNLTTVCDSSMPAVNRRNSDPSLNEKWQEHRRSMELSNLSNPGDDPYKETGMEVVTGNRASIVAELSVAAAEGQILNILQEATKEDSNLEVTQKSPILGIREVALELSSKESQHEEPKLEPEEETIDEKQFSGAHNDSQEISCLPLEEQPVFEADTDQREVTPQPLGELKVAVTTLGSPLFANIIAKTREGMDELERESFYSTPLPSPSQSALANQEAKVFTMESSTETVTGYTVRLEKEGGGKGPCLTHSRVDHVGITHNVEASNEKYENFIRPHSLEGNVNRTSKDSGMLPPIPLSCALLVPEFKGPLSNGELGTENNLIQKPVGLPIPLKPIVPNGHCVNGEEGLGKASLSRQLSSLSCGSAQCHWRNVHHKCVHQGQIGRQSPNTSPDQPTRSHLDDDGMPVYMDIVQQRLRQIETGHQQEVETLKRQVQELRSRLESQYLNSSLRYNGEFADEVTSMPDTESNLDPNCLSRCSTEIFSEASWEQVDKQDTEVTRWLPDHLAANCYGCDSKFWLASRKHHCRDRAAIQESWNCGNVFCSSCCNQKVPVPSQQLFEPSRVCKMCYSNLHPNGSTLDHELEKPIAATSN